MSEPSHATLYLKRSCPHCLKLRIFLTEAGLADRFTYVVFDDGDETHKALRARMAAEGQEPSFPAADFGADLAADLGDGRLTTGTDGLIARLAQEAGVDPAAMPLLGYYTGGVFQRYGEMFRELKALKAG